MSATNFLAPRSETATSAPFPTPRLPSPPPSSPVKKRRFPRRKFFLLFFVLLFGFGVFVGIGGYHLVHGGLALKRAAGNAETALELGDLGQGRDALYAAENALREVKNGLTFFAFLKPVPWIGEQLHGGEATVDAALETTVAVHEGLSILLDALSTVQGASGVVGTASGGGESHSYSSLTEEEKYLLLQSLASSLPDLRKMQVKLRLAERDIARLDDLNLAPQIKNAIAPLKEKLPELVDAVDIIVPFAAIAPQFAGLHQDRQFLMLFLNNDEIRPGGGFIGVYGLLLMRNGDIQSLVTDDSYNIDAYVEGSEEYFVTPPQALRRFLIPEWYFRDSAWSPDFSQSAKDAVQLFRQEIAYGGQPVPEIHGVVGITPSFIARVLNFVGPITVEGQTFTSENIATQLEWQVEKQYDVDGIPEEQRKEIVSKVTDVMVERLKEMPPSSWPDFFKLLHAAFAEKELVFMSTDSRTQAALEDAGWAGVVNPAASDDLLMVVDANLGALKTDPLVDRHISYKIIPRGNTYRATVNVTYTNTATKRDWRTTMYRTYTRVYAPLGSTLVSSSGSLANDPSRNPELRADDVVVADELGMTSFGAFTAIDIQQSRTLSFTYDLPSHVADAIRRGDYDLQVFKQVGARDNLLTLDLDFGTTVTQADPAEAQENWGDTVYHLDTTLEADKHFRVRL